MPRSLSTGPHLDLQPSFLLAWLQDELAQAPIPADGGLRATKLDQLPEEDVHVEGGAEHRPRVRPAVPRATMLLMR